MTEASFITAMNPDRARIREFLASPDVPLAFDSSPLLLALGTTIVSAGNGRVLLRFEPAPLFMQGASVVQGGAVSAMLDFAMAAAIMTTLDDNVHFATASLTVSFLAAVKPGALLAEGKSTASAAVTDLRARACARRGAMRSWPRHRLF